MAYYWERSRDDSASLKAIDILNTINSFDIGPVSRSIMSYSGSEDSSLEYAVRSSKKGIAPEKYSLGKVRNLASWENEMEELLLNKLHLLFDSSSALPFAELRPEREVSGMPADKSCGPPASTGIRRLSDFLFKYDGKSLRFNERPLKEYVKRQGFKDRFIQIHLNDIIYNPLAEDWEVMSVSSGEKGAAGRLYLGLARFLHEHNTRIHPDAETVVPVHLPYYESFRNVRGGLTEWGGITEDHKREATWKANQVLGWLQSRWKDKNGKPLKVRLALETGAGPILDKSGRVRYALLHEPHLFQFLSEGRENMIGYCIDTGHLNLREDTTFKDYLDKRIDEIHLNGNEGKGLDQHLIAGPGTLKEWDEQSSWIKVFPRRICFEFGRQDMEFSEYVSNVKSLVKTLFFEDYSTQDRRRIDSIRNYLASRGKVFEESNIQEAPQ